MIAIPASPLPVQLPRGNSDASAEPRAIEVIGRIECIWARPDPARCRRLTSSSRLRDFLRSSGGECIMADVKILATGLGFPEGPVVCADGSVVLTEIRNQRCSRVTPDGKVSLFSNCGGGPNGLAIGPDGYFYLCNNGGSRYVEGHSMGLGPHPDYKFGSIERIDPKTGEAKLLYKDVNGHHAVGAERPGVRHGRRLLFHRSRQALSAPPRQRRRLLRAAGRLQDRRGGLSHAEPQRLRPVAGRQDALCRRHRRGAAVGLRGARTRQAQAQEGASCRTAGG